MGVGHNQRGDAPVDIQLALNLFVQNAGDDRGRRTATAEQARGFTALRNRNNRACLDIGGGCAGCMGQRGAHAQPAFVGLCVVNKTVIAGISLGRFGNGNHGTQSSHRVFAGGCFAAEHDSRRTVVNRIGNVGDFGTGRPRIADH